MKKILLVSGHEHWESSPGKLNETLMKSAESYFSENGFSTITTSCKGEYIISDEVEKFLWADIIIYFTPVYWFDVPAGFKSYIERVFSGGKTKLFKDDGRSDGGKYGTGGYLNTTKYMLITTWNAPEEAFNNSSTSFLFDNKSVDDVFLHFHSAQKFLGMKKMPGIHFYDVKRNPKIDDYLLQLHKHLKFNINT